MLSLPLRINSSEAMEIPADCLRPSMRVTRKRKKMEEADPDYNPVKPTTGTGRKVTGPRKTSKVESEIQNKEQTSTSTTPNAEFDGQGTKRRVRQLRRSKTIESIRKKPPPKVNYIKRPEYSVEDWREKAKEVRSRRNAAKNKNDNTEVANVKGRRQGKNKAKDDMALERYKDDTAGSDKQEQRKIEEVKFKVEVEEALPDKPFEFEVEDFELDNLPNFVMGTGKGTEGGPPLYDFKSLWTYELPEITLEDCRNEASDYYPWEEPIAQPDTIPQILSIVACFSVGQGLDLKKIATGAKNVEYNPDRFAPLVMRVRNPKSTALIFRTGRIVLSGTKSEDDCRRAAEKFADIIRKFGYRADILNFHIQNISAKCNLNFRVRLNQLSRNKLFGNLCYEPEIFPGLEIALECPKVKVRVFCTGSVVMSGAKSMEDLHEALRIVYPLVRMYAP